MVEPKIFWLINQYASTPETGMGGRHYNMARELAKQGHKVYLIAASYTHILRQPPKMSENVWLQMVEGFQFVWLRMPSYPEAHSKKRVLNWFLFAWMLGKLPGWIPDKPDAILYSSPPLVGYLGARRLARLFHVPLSFEVRDIWPLTLIEIGGYSPGHPFIRFLQWIEDKAYRDSDRVISNLKNAVEHMKMRDMNPDKFAWIPNGFSLSEVAHPKPLPANVRAQLPLNKFIVGYTGTLGMANALDTLIEAADLLKTCDDIVFVLVGGGKEKLPLQRLVEKKGLNNVVFVDPIPKAQIQSMLACFDVCFIGWLNNHLYRFGIGANKISEYFLSGRPVLHAYSGKCDPVEEAAAGVTVPAENAEALSRAVLDLKALTPLQRDKMGQNGRVFAMTHHEYGALAERLANVLLGKQCGYGNSGK